MSGLPGRRKESLTPWLFLGAAAVLIAQAGPGAPRFVRSTLVLVLIYLLLTNVDQVYDLGRRWTRQLGGMA